MLKKPKNPLRRALLNPDELERLNALLFFEREAKSLGYQMIAGVDEAGRGPLAGPVVAAACIVSNDLLIPGIDDSKKLPAKKREKLYLQICSHSSISYGVGIVNSQEIDRINILNATSLAMTTALFRLRCQPDYLLVDGMELAYRDILCKKIIKGDSLSYSIAAASILAKVVRDKHMRAYHTQFPHYGFDRHKGYGTAEHLRALQQYGPCEIHRRSFAPVKASCKYSHSFSKLNSR